MDHSGAVLAAGGRDDDDGWRGGALCTLRDEEQQLELETNIREV